MTVIYGGLTLALLTVAVDPVFDSSGAEDVMCAVVACSDEKKGSVALCFVANLQVANVA